MGKHKEKKKKKQQDGNDSDGNDETIRSFRVDEVNGAFVCDCPQFKSTGKTCPEILALRLHLKFGSAKPYLGKFT